MLPLDESANMITVKIGMAVRHERRSTPKTQPSKVYRQMAGIGKFFLDALLLACILISIQTVETRHATEKTPSGEIIQR